VPSVENRRKVENWHVRDSVGQSERPIDKDYLFLRMAPLAPPFPPGVSAPASTDLNQVGVAARGLRIRAACPAI
jgi:hypothetical protein